MKKHEPPKLIARHTAESGYKKIEERTHASVPRPKSSPVPRQFAMAIGQGILNVIHESAYPEPVRASFAGSIRREQEEIHDIDILICPFNIHVQHKLESLGEILWNGNEKLSFVLTFEQGEPNDPTYKITYLQVDIRYIKSESWGPALQYFTGSREHNISLRMIAKSKGFTLNEHGLFDSSGKRMDDGSEGSVYKLLGLRWLPPKYRNKYIGRWYVLTAEQRQEEKTRCPICDRPIRNSVLKTHIKNNHQGFEPFERPS